MPIDRSTIISSLGLLALGAGNALAQEKQAKTATRPSFEQIRVVEESKPVCIGVDNQNKFVVYRSNPTTEKCAPLDKNSAVIDQSKQPIIFTVQQGLESFGKLPEGFRRCVVFSNGAPAYVAAPMINGVVPCAQIGAVQDVAQRLKNREH